MKSGFAIFLFLPNILYGFYTCCKEGEILDLSIGSSPLCVNQERSTVSSKNQLLSGLTSSGVKYPGECTELEHFEVNILSNLR